MNARPPWRRNCAGGSGGRATFRRPAPPREGRCCGTGVPPAPEMRPRQLERTGQTEPDVVLYVSKRATTRMPYFDLVWNTEPGGNVEHFLEHGITPEDA